MSFISFVIFVEIGISIMLFLFGYQGAIFGSLLTAFSDAVGVSTPNITTTNQTGYIAGDQGNFEQSSLQGNGMFFNIFTVLFGTAAVFAGLGLLGASNFSAIYIVPALMIMLILWLLLSPIISIINLIIVDPAFSILGWILWLVFVALNVWGCITFIRGYGE